MEALPFSQACENNKGAIVEILQHAFADRRQVLEIGSGTGQHACHFASCMPWLTWQPTDLAHNLENLQRRLGSEAPSNVLPALELDVRQPAWPLAVPDAIFTANSLHIMPMPAVCALFDALRGKAGGDVVLAVYGPFNYNGQYTSPSNAQFDQWLAQQSPDSAIRHFEAIDELAGQAGFELQSDHPMPANNRLLIWERS
tara:strand:- start:142261 stop:142857 length:597 start_codon:yes stop_codon:yes gene_type:complete